MMNKEEILEAIQDDKMMPFIQPEQLVQIVAFVIKNYRSSLPADLDEAAIKYGHEEPILPEDYNDGDIPDYERWTAEAFKAGAEWMAGQGVNADFEVCKLANRAWLTPIDEKRFAQDVFGNFEAGDKVIVQIRKK